MSKASKLVADAILQKDYTTVWVAGKTYVVNPPTIKRLALAGRELSGMGDETTMGAVLRSLGNSKCLARALSFLVCGTDKLAPEMSSGTFDELVDALCEAYSLLSLDSFTRLSALARNVSRLIANPKC